MQDVDIAKPFIKATVNVIFSMANINVLAGKPYVKKENMAIGDVSAIIGITGYKKGSISITFSKKCALAIVNKLLGNEIHDIVNDVKDTVGEITNIISGQARLHLASMGMTFHGSTPSIIMGKDHTITHITKNVVIAIPFKTDYGNFTLEFCFE